MKTYCDIAGYLGSALALLGYLLFAVGMIAGVGYFSIGVVTSALLGVHSWERRSRPLLWFNSVMGLISVYGLVRMLL